MKRNIGLRTVLLMLVFAAVAPGLAVVIYSTIMLQRDELQRARDELHSVTKLAAATQEQWIDGVRQILTTVASGPSVRRSDLRGLCTEFLRNVKASSPTYTNIGVLDLNGQVQCEALESDKTLNRSNRYYFQAVVESRQFAVGDFVVSYSSGNKALGFGMPVFDYTGVLAGVAFSGVDLDYPSKRLEALALPKQLQISVSDIKGTLLATSGTDHTGVGKPVSDPTLRAAMLARTAKAIDSTIAGVEWLHSVQPVDVAGPTGVVVAVSVRKADALAIAHSYFRSQLIIMLVASLIGFLLALFLAQRTLWQPIARLLARMREVERSGGTDMASAPPNSNSEFAEIDAVFDSMMTKLRVNQLQLIKAQQITRVGFYQLDLKENLYTASPIVYEILGLDPAMGPVTIAQYQATLHPDDRALVNEQRNRLFEGGEPLRLQYRIVRPNGEVRWIDGFGFVEKDRNGKPSAYSGAIQDITDRMLSEQDTRNIEKRFQLLFENSLDGVLQTSPDGTILAANAAACDIFGWTEEQLKQRGRAGVVLTSDPRLGRLLEERKQTGKARGQLTMVRADGSLFEAELTSSVYADARGDLINSMVLRDISDRIKSEQHIHRLAFFDALTDLPNRRLLMDRLEFLLASAQRSGLIGAVLFLDLDHFKNVNDARGHAIGDALLQQVAFRLGALMRTQDTVARMGGDEFVVLLPDLAADFINAAQSAMVVAEKLRHALTQPFFIENQQYLSGGSIGVTLLPKVGQTADDLLREADTAMYRAKQAGRNRIAFFEAEMQTEVEGRLGLEHDLAQAIGSSQLEMLVQPQYDHNARPIGAEMLMRWTHPVRGPVSPVLFIPIAEESGLILALGDWVMRQGCLAVLRLEEAGQAMPISINVSPLQFRQPDFVARVRAVLSETGAPASQLIFEVTEGLLIDNLDETILRMRELVALGIRFSIDDFGTGYSSLAYLRQLPLYELKIDRSFVMDTPGDPGSTAIVQSILAMAGHLGLHVVAEGVETTEQAKFLQAAGCAALQGYLFARPMPLERLLQHELQAS